MGEAKRGLTTPLVVLLGALIVVAGALGIYLLVIQKSDCERFQQAVEESLAQFPPVGGQDLTPDEMKDHLKTLAYRFGQVPDPDGEGTLEKPEGCEPP